MLHKIRSCGVNGFFFSFCDLCIYFFYMYVCLFVLNVSSFRCQQAANIVRALELFVKPDVLSGENAYMCAK